jgi:hypothetical protein
LRQRVEAAGVDPARDEIVARTFGVERVSMGVSISTKPESIECGARRRSELVPQPYRALQPGTAQVDVAVLEPEVFASVGLVVHGKRHAHGRIVDDDVGDANLDLPRRVRGVRRFADHDAPPYTDDVFRMELFGDRVERGVVGIEHDLHAPRRVPHLDEDQLAEVAAAMDPARQDDLALLFGVGSGDLTAADRPVEKPCQLSGHDRSFRDSKGERRLRFRLRPPRSARRSRGSSGRIARA